MITAAKNAELCTASLLGSTMHHCKQYKVGRQESTDAISVMLENSDPSGSRATVISRDQRVPQSLWGDRRCHYRKPVDLSITSPAHYLALQLRTCASSILKNWSMSSNSPLRSTSAR